MRFLHLKLLMLLVIVIASSRGELTSKINVGVSSLDFQHAKNLIRTKSLILRESGFSEDNLPVVNPELKARVQAAFNNSEYGYAFYNEEEAWDWVNLIGHTKPNASGIVSFAFSDKTQSSRIETAEIRLFLRTARSPTAQKVIVQVTDEYGNVLANTVVNAPNAPFKQYPIALDRDRLQRTMTDAGFKKVIALKVSAKSYENQFDELVMMEGRLGHQSYMGVILVLQFPSDKLLAKRRRSRRGLSEHVMRGQCKPGQTTCCPHIQTFSWEELGFDHIIAPATFHSVICRGTCHDYSYDDYKHTESRQTVSTRIKTPCCHPSTYEDQRVIWMGPDDEVIKRQIPNFYATRCVCD